MEIPTTPATPQTEKPQLTRGQQVMSVNFNPGQREDVAALQQIFADCYDEIDKWTNAAHKRNNTKPVPLQVLWRNGLKEDFKTIQIGNEISHLAAIAKTNLETAQMYAVKAVTR